MLILLLTVFAGLGLWVARHLLVVASCLVLLFLDAIFN